MKHTNNTTMAGRTGKPVPYERAGVQVHDKAGQPGWRLRVYDPRTDRQPEKNFSGTYEQAAVELERWRQELTASAQPLRSGARNMRVSTRALQWLKLRLARAS